MQVIGSVDGSVHPAVTVKHGEKRLLFLILNTLFFLLALPHKTTATIIQLFVFYSIYFRFDHDSNFVTVTRCTEINVSVVNSLLPHTNSHNPFLIEINLYKRLSMQNKTKTCQPLASNRSEAHLINCSERG